MGRGIADLFVALNTLLPFEAVVAIGVVLAIVAIPLWIESMRQKQLRGLVRRMVRADAPERERLTAEMFRLAGGRPRRLETIAQNAIKYDQRRLRDAAIEALQATGRAPAEVRRLRDTDRKPSVRVTDALQAAVRVERLIEDGLLLAAREHLDAALGTFPEDAELLTLRQRLDDQGAAPEASAPRPQGEPQAQ